MQNQDLMNNIIPKNRLERVSIISTQSYIINYLYIPYTTGINLKFKDK